MSLSSMVAAGQAAVLKCEATLNALQAAFTQARRELAEGQDDNEESSSEGADHFA